MTATSRLLKFLATFFIGAAMQSCISPNAVLNFGPAPTFSPAPSSSPGSNNSDHLAFLVQPSSVTVNTAINPTIQVAFLNQDGGLDTGNTGIVTLAIGNFATAGAVLAGTLTVSAVSGVATFSGISINLAGTGYTLNAQSGSLPVVTSSPFNINTATAGIATKVVFMTQPTSAVSRGILGSILVAVEDSFGNPVTSSSAPIAISIGNNAGPGGTLFGTLTFNASSGIATFTGLNIDIAGSGYTLTASSPSLTSATSASFNITPGPPSQLAFTTQPTTGVRQGASFSPVVVSVEDAAGNLVTTSSYLVNVFIQNNAGPGGTLVGVSSLNSSLGQVSFNNLDIDIAGNSYTLGAQTSGLAVATSNAFNVLPAPAWISGSTFVNQGGTYGIEGLGTSSNVPGARQTAGSWTDSAGKFWLFGGSGIDSISTFGFLNDLWQFNPTTQFWEWMAGNAFASQTGVCGTQGTPGTLNTPGGRTESITWIDSSNNLWLFGGSGIDCAGASGLLNDLWKYNTTTFQWTWVGGSSAISGHPTYGTKGTGSTSNIPGARESAISWTDSSGNFWLFGGNGFDSGGNAGYLNDLWEYTPGNSKWTWISGGNIFNTAGTYGVQGTGSTSNIPGGRENAVSWKDSSGNLWLFGGFGWDSAGAAGPLNDLWEYTPGTLKWTWVSGSATNNHPGAYGTQGIGSVSNTPGTRSISTSWTDSSGNFWLLGGSGEDIAGTPGSLNDLWQFNPSNLQWTWVSGASVVNHPGVYGTRGVGYYANFPGARFGATVWIDSSQNKWLFGGDGYDSSGTESSLNDLWMLPP